MLEPFTLGKMMKLFLLAVIFLLGCGESNNGFKRSPKLENNNSKVELEFLAPSQQKKVKVNLITIELNSLSKNCNDITEEYKADEISDTFEVTIPKDCEYNATIKGYGLLTNLVTYEKTILPIMQKHCIECHKELGHMQAFPFTDVNIVKKKIDKIIERLKSGSMPLNGTAFKPEEIKPFEIWKENGLPISESQLDKELIDNNKLVCKSEKIRIEKSSLEAYQYSPNYTWFK